MSPAPTQNFEPGGCWDFFIAFGFGFGFGFFFFDDASLNVAGGAPPAANNLFPVSF